ncbi:hypothetical protein GCM10009789_38560 [Kribbella sancticallisti]|uniref:Thioredoxin domain-containing protein n=1 Tax=Kribbella sancticallisti TaxID=460087 RepID=A0ABN2DN37_9ACTN
MSDWIDIRDEAAFARLVMDSRAPMVVAFENEACTGCHEHRARLSAAWRLLGRPGRSVRVDADRLPDLASRFRIVGFPTVALFSGGQPVERFLGWRNQASLTRRIAGLLDGVPDRRRRSGVSSSRQGARRSRGAA